MAEATFNKLVLDVRNLDTSLEFYNRVLQCPIHRQEEFEGHRLAYIGTGATELLLVEQPEVDQVPDFVRPGGQVMNFQVKNLRGIANELVSRNLVVLRDLEMAVWGERTFLVADPDGYVVLLSEPVHG